MGKTCKAFSLDLKFWLLHTSCHFKDFVKCQNNISLQEFQLLYAEIHFNCESHKRTLNFHFKQSKGSLGNCSKLQKKTNPLESETNFAER
jgi:hypothetical protein